MICRLSIKNYAIIRSLDIEFEKGLVILTGETGSGKSILLGALGLIMGDRADTKVVFNTEEKCSVEAEFSIKNYKLEWFFKENDLDYEEPLIIRREISQSGKSRAFINDTPASLSILQELSSYLIDLHQQFDTLSINSDLFQINVIDALAGTLATREDFQKKWKSYQKILLQIKEMDTEEKRMNAERDFLEFQLNELNEAGFRIGEQEELEEELKSLEHAEEIKLISLESQQMLDGTDASVISQLRSILSRMRQLERYYNKAADMLTRLDQVMIELEEMSRELEDIHESAEIDPQRLASTQQKVDLLYRLIHKHQASDLEELLLIQAQIKDKLLGFEQINEHKSVLEGEAKILEDDLNQLAAKLSSARAAQIPGFEKAVMDVLARVNMEQAVFKIDLESAESYNAYGKDKLKFLCATNKGSRMLPLKDVASGGELSRIALSIKSLVANALSLPTMIFDEIDTGVSGQVALQMGHLLKKLATGHQVIVITHTPQVAARADQHMKVYKTTEGDQNVTKISVLSKTETIEAVAVMLSTEPPTPAALNNAKELISLN